MGRTKLTPEQSAANRARIQLEASIFEAPETPHCPKGDRIVGRGDPFRDQIDAALVRFHETGELPNGDEIRKLLTVSCLRDLSSGTPMNVKDARAVLSKIHGLESKTLKQVASVDEGSLALVEAVRRSQEGLSPPEMPTKTAGRVIDGGTGKRLQAPPPGVEREF